MVVTIYQELSHKIQGRLVLLQVWPSGALTNPVPEWINNEFSTHSAGEGPNDALMFKFGSQFFIDIY